MVLGFGCVYFLPVRDAARDVDAIVVLGVPNERLGHALELANRGYADNLVVSSPDPLSDPARVPWICRDYEDGATIDLATTMSLYCFTPDPFDTRGEAEYVQQLANEQGWDTVMVVTYRTHVSRARWYFDQCAPDVDSYFIGITRGWRPGIVLERFAYETGGWMKAATVSGC
jgi:uncharacterized SAM-binding protein YcdF (DUF218 family)